MYVLLWLSCGVIAALIQHHKRLPIVGGVIIGLLLGPFGVLLLLLAKPAPDPTMITCSFCQSPIPAAATVCRYCQREQPSLIAK